MDAKKAKELTLMMKPVYDVKNRKKAEKELIEIYSKIKDRADRGQSRFIWEYRECHDVEYIIQELKKKGYSISMYYSLYEINWE